MSADTSMLDSNKPVIDMGSRHIPTGSINWLGLHALYMRETNRFLKVWMQTIFSPVVSSLLFLAVFRLAFPERPPVNGVSFADFLVPGIVMMAILNNAFQNTSSSMAIAKMQGNTSDFLTAPLSAWELCAGFVAGAATRGVLVGAVTIIGVALAGAANIGTANVSISHWPALIFFSVTAAVFMGAAGLLGGLWADKFDHLAAITNFVIMPLSMLSGTFYPASALGEPFRVLLNINPFYYLIDGLRFAMTGHAESDLQTGVWVTSILSLGLCLACWAMFRSGYKVKT